MQHPAFRYFIQQLPCVVIKLPRLNSLHGIVQQIGITARQTGQSEEITPVDQRHEPFQVVIGKYLPSCFGREPYRAKIGFQRMCTRFGQRTERLILGPVGILLTQCHLLHLHVDQKHILLWRCDPPQSPPGCNRFSAVQDRPGAILRSEPHCRLQGRSGRSADQKRNLQPLFLRDSQQESDLPDSPGRHSAQ